MHSPPQSNKRANTNITTPNCNNSQQKQPTWARAASFQPSPNTASQNVSPTKSKVINERFSLIEQELISQHERNKLFDNRITGLEQTTHRIDSNVAAILLKLDSIQTTPAKLRKTSNSSNNDTDMNIDSDHNSGHFQQHQDMGYTSP
jgi:hypothetical protein